ncbi:hypothetical protein [Ruegeria sp. YS9]|nr:hypothetical protein [Ruegeria sp. YS9]UUV05769.1 hypothetical protein NOR97_14235 [Ruegeria sp. YS9]
MIGSSAWLLAHDLAARIREVTGHIGPRPEVTIPELLREEGLV